MTSINRRDFVKSALVGAGAATVSVGVATGLGGCSGEGLVPGEFLHGVASGDPLQHRAIIWTRVSPSPSTRLKDGKQEKIRVFWEVSTQPDFDELVHADSVLAEPHRDFTVKVDLTRLLPGTQYYYRFSTISHQSVTGRTKTLPEGDVSSVKILALSCSNYPAGFFHVYAEAAKQGDADVALHLGDYIYEHARGGYASEDAEAFDREVEPAHETVTLDDYRRRYAQYRSDTDLQDFHAAMPVIAVWDDHEIANDAWRLGAENHDPETQGDYFERLGAALVAYAEWMPIRASVDTDLNALPRQFIFGNLVNLLMLDTRIAGRDEPLNYNNYYTAEGSFDFARFDADRLNVNRSLLGSKQRTWLYNAIAEDSAWQVLGQQVLIGKMELPGALMTQQLSLQEYGELAAIAALAENNPEALSAAQRQLLEEKGALLALPTLPYNLDAWDGYAAERESLFAAAQAVGKELIVLAGDTHNAWANNLRHNDESVGLEFATASVTSPGLEGYLGLDSPAAVEATEFSFVQMIRDLQYANLYNRGYLSLTFTREEVTAEWTFIDSIKSANTYTVLEERNKRYRVNINNLSI